MNRSSLRSNSCFRSRASVACSVLCACTVLACSDEQSPSPEDNDTATVTSLNGGMTAAGSGTETSSGGGTSPVTGASTTAVAGSAGTVADGNTTGGNGAGGAPASSVSETGGMAGAAPASGGSVASGGMAPLGQVGGSGGDGSGGAGEMATGGMGGMAVVGMGGVGGAAGGAGAGGDSSTQGPTLPPIEDYSAKGPFETTIEQNVGPGNAYMVIRPDPLADDGFLHAPIIFGAGIGDQVSTHTEMLTYFASHGFVVVGSPVLNGGPGDQGNLQKMLDGLDWILEQNEADGIYKGKIYVDHAISMGHSVGATASVQVGEHEAIATVVSIHGHETTAELHGTMLQTSGTKEDVKSDGMLYSQSTYEMSKVPTFLATLSGASHGYITNDAGGVERPAILAWMRYWIYGDTGGEHYFLGDDCVMCTSPWENPQRKNFP